MSSIPLDWVKGYIDALLTFAAGCEKDSAMRNAALLRADHVMDLVRAWKETLK